MRSTVHLTVDITHEQNLPTDAQGIANLVATHLTRELAADPMASATAKVDSAFIVRGKRDWFERVYQGRTVKVREVGHRFNRTGTAIRGWYDKGDPLVRVVVDTTFPDRYEVMDFAGNWQEA